MEFIIQREKREHSILDFFADIARGVSELGR